MTTQPSSQPQGKPSSTPSSGDILREIRQGTQAQQREISNQLRQSPGGMGIDAALRMLQFLEEKVPCLDESQRMALLDGKGIGYSTSPAAIELRERLQSWWIRADDRQAVDSLLQLLIAHGCLPLNSVRLLKRVRSWVETELVRQKLPRLQTVAWCRDQVIRRAAEAGIEIDIDAEVAALVSKVLAEYRSAVKDADQLVFGEMNAAEARTWLACSRAVVKEKGLKAFTMAGQPLTAFHQETQIMRLFNSCRKWGVDGPDALQKLLDRHLRGWHGNPNELIKDPNGQWRWGDGQVASPEVVVAFRSVREDLGDGFGPRPTTVPVESQGFSRRGQGYSELFRDKTMFDVLTEIRRAENAANNNKNQTSEKE